MANDLSALNPAQAQLLVSLMQTQNQTDAINAFLGSSDTTSSNGATSTDNFASLLSSVMGLSGTTAQGTTIGSTAPTTTTGADIIAALTSNAVATPTDTGSTPTGQSIATAAQQLATDLRGANNRYFDTTQTPQAAQQAFDTPGWGNGNVQCVAFVDGAYRQAGITLPTTPNATDFWGAYANRPGWQEVANGQGLPQPGDIVVMGGGAQGYGHVAIVTSVTPAANGQPGTIHIAQSNSPTSTASLTLAADGSVTAWPGYPVKGFIRSA